MPVRNWEDAIAEKEMKEFIAECMRSEPEETDIDFCRRILDQKSAGVWIGDGPNEEWLVDSFSASAVVAVYDALSDSGKEKLRSFNLRKKIIVCFKVCK